MPSMPPAPASQDLQSCVEQLEAHPLKRSSEARGWVTPPCSAPHSDNQWKSNKFNGVENYGGNGGLSSFYSLCQPSQIPLVKMRTPPPRLTTYNTKYPESCKMNLEIITEILGSESGVGYSDCDFPIGGDGSSERKELEREVMVVGEKNKRRVPPEFPPPLTTLCDGDPIRLKSRRESGRLVLVPFNPNIFGAERKDGHLRLRLLRSWAFNGPDEVGEAEEGKAGLKTEEEKGDGEVEDEEEGICGGIGGDEGVGSGKYRRAGRCKEEEVGGTRRSNTILNCDAFFVVG